MKKYLTILFSFVVVITSAIIFTSCNDDKADHLQKKPCESDLLTHADMQNGTLTITEGMVIKCKDEHPDGEIKVVSSRIDMPVYADNGKYLYTEIFILFEDGDIWSGAFNYDPSYNTSKKYDYVFIKGAKEDIPFFFFLHTGDSVYIVYVDGNPEFKRNLFDFTGTKSEKISGVFSIFFLSIHSKQ